MICFLICLPFRRFWRSSLTPSRHHRERGTIRQWERLENLSTLLTPCEGNVCNFLRFKSTESRQVQLFLNHRFLNLIGLQQLCLKLSL